MRVNPEQYNRRDLLQHLSLASMGVAAISTAGRAAAKPPNDAGDIYTPPGVNVELPAEAGTLPRAVYEHPDSFDLSDPRHLKLARLKVLNSLSGDTTYFYTVTRHFLCPPGKPPHPIVAEMELTTIWLERRTDMSNDQCIVRAMFTRAPLDPVSFKPTDMIHNPYSGKNMPLKYTMFSGGGFELNLSGDTPPDLITQSDEPHYRIGDDIAFIMFDPKTSDGAFQPRMDTVTWRTKYDTLMDPNTPLIEAEHTYTSIMKASVFKMWSGVEEGDPAQVLTSKVGRKLCSVGDLPREVHEYIVKKFPHRV